MTEVLTCALPISQTARQNCAFLALESADALIQKGDISGGMAQLKTALKYSKSPKVLRSASRIFLWNRTISIGKRMVESGGYRESIEM